jgi:hypothetical protein
MIPKLYKEKNHLSTKKIATKEEKSKEQNIIIKDHQIPLHHSYQKMDSLFCNQQPYTVLLLLIVPVEPCPDSSDNIDNAQNTQSRANRETHQGYVVGV